MRMPREVERLVKEGAALSADEAAALEGGLEQQPHDLEARARLLGYYGAQRAKAFKGDIGHRLAIWPATPTDDDRARHARWLAENAPHAPLAVHDLVHFSMVEPAYADLSSIWRRHAAADPPDATLLAHAIAFFGWENETFADELLARSQELFPDDARWPRFRRERQARFLCTEYRLQRKYGRRLPLVEGASETEPIKPKEVALEEMEDLLRADDVDEFWMSQLREEAAEICFELGRTDRARAHAEQLLVSDVGGGAQELSDAAHNGHLLLGRIALHAGDVTRANVHLTLAGEAGATGLVTVFGPDTRLAKDLLARGEREVVIRYLTACRAFWERGPVDEWIAAIRAGGVPDFDARR